MTNSPHSESLARAQRLLFGMPTLEAVIARREAGAAHGSDADSASDLAHELTLHQSDDGSWAQSLALTSEALLLLAALRPFDHDVTESLARALDWLRSRQRAAGAFGQICTPDRHALALCPHFITGFFSPGSPDVSFAETALANGARFSSDEDARLALSALALRAVLTMEAPLIDDLLHVDALSRIAELLFRGENAISTATATTVLAALIQAPRTPARMSALHGALSRLTGMQRADGTWPGADPFLVADVYLQATAARYGSPLFDRAIARTAELLAVSQKADGSWDAPANPYRMLTGWRTLRYVTNLRTQ